jgi:hypothetical protein
MQRNMTDTQKRNAESNKEGKIVNAFVKDQNLSLDETLDSLVISRKEIDLPQKVFEQEKDKNNGLLYLAGAAVGTMGLLGGFTLMIKNFAEKKLNSTKEFLLPGITRNHCINDEVHQSIFSMIQSPNRKTILASFIDGYRDVWVKKQEADIQKKLQENLIEVETQSFSGKIQIIRSMLSSKAKEFAPSFKGKEGNEQNKASNKNNLGLVLLGGITLATITALGYFSMRNLRKSDEFIKSGLENTKQGLDNVINNFNSGVNIQPIEGHNGEVLQGKDAYKHVIENMLESIYATPSLIEETVKKMNLPKQEQEEFSKHLKLSMNQATEKVNSAIGGSGRNKITYFSHVNDYLSFFYDWLMNPKNPQFKNLFFGISGITALAYGGKTFVEAVKDVQVKKYNAETELELQKRLVATELRNFKAKKESAIEPLCNEFFEQKANGKSPEELKIMADNILFEIKNGPPFVYS